MDIKMSQMTDTCNTKIFNITFIKFLINLVMFVLKTPWHLGIGVYRSSPGNQAVYQPTS